MKLAIILGTRPEIIKMSPIIRACKKLGVDFFVLHTGQHYSHELDGQMFADLELDKPHYNLGAGRYEYRKQMGHMIREITKILKKEGATVALVQGDTNSVLAGALAANKLGIKVAHHEAGLRSHDLTMLEEINRITTDHISDFLFAPTTAAFQNIKDENIDKPLHLTGNTIVDAVKQNLKIADSKTNILKKLGLKNRTYAVATAHRAENVDNKIRLAGILKGLGLVTKNLEIPVIYPMHPRTAKNITAFGLKIPNGVKVTEPLGYLEFLQLTASAKLILTDSGGLQEEACILKIPCVTMRNSTERPETIIGGTNILADADPQKILNSAKIMLAKKIRWANPFGNGNAGEKIINIIHKNTRAQHNKLTGVV